MNRNPFGFSIICLKVLIYGKITVSAGHFHILAVNHSWLKIKAGYKITAV